MENCLIIVPHQDDEINLTGNILNRLVDYFNVYIVFSSSESDKYKRKIRTNEAINSCKIYGIAKENIIFLNHIDTPNKNNKHYFTQGDKTIVGELEKIIDSIVPILIIGTDFDSHSDHRMLSIALEEAICNCVKGNQDYHPIVFKGFCYETGYYGANDYSAYCLGKTVVDSTNLSNLSYEWDKKISILSNEKNGFIINKRAYKSLREHKSQYACLHAGSVINADNVFWLRRTDNLLFDKKCDVSTSSGDKTKLFDYKIVDTDDIITNDPYKIDYSKSVWWPAINDKNPFISISFIDKVTVKRMVFHTSVNQIKRSNSQLDVIVNGKKMITLNELLERGRDTMIDVCWFNVQSIVIVFNYLDSEFCGLSELEIYRTISQDEMSRADIVGLLEENIIVQPFGNKLFTEVLNTILLKFVDFSLRCKRKMKKMLNMY